MLCAITCIQNFPVTPCGSWPPMARLTLDNQIPSVIQVHRTFYLLVDWSETYTLEETHMEPDNHVGL